LAALVADGSFRRGCCTPVARRRSLTTSARKNRPMLDPTKSGRVPRMPGPSLPGLCWSFSPRDRRQLAAPTSWTGTRSRTPQLWARVLGDSKPLEPTAPCGTAPRVYTRCVSEPSEDRLCHLHRVPRTRTVQRRVAPSGFEPAATALRGRSVGCWLKLDNLEGRGFAGSELLVALADDDRFWTCC